MINGRGVRVAIAAAQCLRFFPLNALFVAVPLSLSAGSALAAGTEEDESAQAEAMLPPVVVVDSAESPPAVEIPPTRSDTTIGREEIERRAPDTVFEMARNAPGVMVEGGPRASGMKFNIRGFSDNEDVVFKIDGAAKGFEKYRFGGGVFVEPELLKSIQIERGPALSAGSGALGGVISATTRSAADLLRPGQRVGAMAKYGYNDNNYENMRMLAAYARPTGMVDLLASGAWRDSNDIKIADGGRLAVSATRSRSSLFKIGLFPSEYFDLELSRIAYGGGPERAPYDSTNATPGTWGVVRRSIDDETINLKCNWLPPTSLIAMRGLVAKERTHLHDRHIRGETGICATGTTALCDDYWEYDIWTAELFNDASYALGPVDGKLTLGVQSVHSERDIRRRTSNAFINQAIYPGGFNEAQPPGNKVSRALIVENAFRWRGLTFTPGLRWDHYRVAAQDQSRDNMLVAGQEPTIDVSMRSRAAALSWEPADTGLAFTYRYNEAFRPPNVDEYFARANFGSRCKPAEFHPVTGRFTGGSALYDPETGIDLAPASGICGDLYRPQESVNEELILAWAPRGRDAHGGRWQFRLVFYRIHTRYLLESIRQYQGRIQQTGEERRHGTEFEMNYESPRWLLGLSYGRTRGKIHDRADGSKTDIYNVPGDTLVLDLGVRLFGGALEGGVRMRDIGDRLVLADEKATECTGPGKEKRSDGSWIGTQHGVRLLDAWLAWRINQQFSLRLSADNLTNRDYCLIGGFGGTAGAPAAGRSVRVSTTFQF